MKFIVFIQSTEYYIFLSVREKNKIQKFKKIIIIKNENMGRVSFNSCNVTQKREIRKKKMSTEKKKNRQPQWWCVCVTSKSNERNLYRITVAQREKQNEPKRERLNSFFYLLRRAWGLCDCNHKSKRTNK